MASISVLSPERRIELNPFDTDAWNLLIRENKARAIESARTFYEKLITQFPNAGMYWKAYIEHELRTKNFDKVEALFNRSLMNVLSIELWKYYLYYLKETKGHLPAFREKMAQAYDLSLEKVGLDLNAHSIYADYIAFLKAVPAIGQYAENQRISAIRKVYHRGILTPMMHIENLWNDYCSYERSINTQLAEKLINDKNKDHQSARRVARMLEQHTRGLNRSIVSVPPRGSATEMKQVELWRKFIYWEKSNPLHMDDYNHRAKRVIYAYDQALLCLGYMPDIWYEAALYQQQTAKLLTERGEVKQAAAMYEEVVAMYEKAICGLMRDSQIIFFSYADFEEERRNFTKAKAVYNRLLERDTLDPTLAYVQLMKFVRRTEGVKSARLVFKRSREDPRANYHVYVASALMEYYCSKDTEVAIRIFDLGLKKYAGDSDYTLAYTDFLSHLNEDNNTRVVFERILNAEQLTPDKSIDIWDQYLEFESQVGDLTSVLKVDDRRRKSLKELFDDKQALLLVDRYRFLNLAPCSADQLRYMGYSKQLRHTAHAAASNGVVASAAAAGTSAAASATAAALNGRGVEIGGFPMPDTDQMLPFKPTPVHVITSHPVHGGTFPPPPSAAMLMQQLPPPWSFHGPFVHLNALMDSLVNFSKEPPSADSRETLDPTATFGGVKAADVKKEMYQLLTTTTDPSVVLASMDASAAAAKKRRMK